MSNSRNGITYLTEKERRVMFEFRVPGGTYYVDREEIFKAAEGAIAPADMVAYRFRGISEARKAYAVMRVRKPAVLTQIVDEFNTRRAPERRGFPLNGGARVRDLGVEMDADTGEFPAIKAKSS